MIIEVRARSQITLPFDIVKKLGIKVGDNFEVSLRDGGIFLNPVVAVVYPKAKLEEIARTVKDHKKNPTAAFESVEDMLKNIGIETEDGDT